MWLLTEIESVFCIDHIYHQANEWTNMGNQRRNLFIFRVLITMTSNERYVVANHRSFVCLFISLCRNIKVRITYPLRGEFTGDHPIPSTEGQ